MHVVYSRIRSILPVLFTGIVLLSLLPDTPLLAAPLYDAAHNFHDPSALDYYDAQTLWIGATLSSLLLFIRSRRSSSSESHMAALPLAAALFDGDGCCLKILRTGMTMHKGLREGHYLHESLPPESAKLMLKAIRKTLETGGPDCFEYALSGTETWYEGKTALAGNASILYVCHDITPRKAAQTAVLQEKEHCQSTLESMGHGVIATDRQGSITYLNPEAAKLTGWPHEKAAGTPLSTVFRILDETSRETAENPALLAIREKEVVRSRKTRLMIRKDGTEFGVNESAAPLKGKTGETLGAVIVFQDISVNKDLLWQVGHDVLTGLLNRVLLHDRLIHSMASVKRQGKTLAVLFIDLDGFKSINDTLGHSVGDWLLKEVAARLKDAVRAEDTAARIGGDEFVVLQIASDRKEIISFLDRIMETISSPFSMDDKQVNISPSIGVVLYPEHDAEPETLLRQADMAMYHAKQDGKNRYHFFDSTLDNAKRSNHERQTRISAALHDGELRLYYQPKIDLRTGKIDGLEALIRWQYPEQCTLILPRDFLPAVQDTKQILEIGTWVIETALAQMQSWQNEGIAVNVSVNIAGRQLQDPGFPEMLKARLEKFPSIPPDRLELEVLESKAVADFSLMHKILSACRKIGVRISLDDFGTGYSSLSHVKNLPVDRLKIDQNIVSGMFDSKDNLAVIRSILSMSKIFKRDVVAEGMESAMQGRMLRRMGCKLAQGYGIAAPMPSADVPQWMAHWPQNPDWMNTLQ